MRFLFSIAACLAALACAGCDGDSSDADVRNARLWDTPYVRALSLPEMVDSAIASGDPEVDFSSTLSSSARPDADGSGGLAATGRDAAGQPAGEAAPLDAPDLPLRPDPALAGSRSMMASACCSIGMVDEMPRYDWAIDPTGTADQ